MWCAESESEGDERSGTGGKGRPFGGSCGICATVGAWPLTKHLVGLLSERYPWGEERSTWFSWYGSGKLPWRGRERVGVKAKKAKKRTENKNKSKKEDILS
jgi:hypothetical protein